MANICATCIHRYICEKKSLAAKMLRIVVSSEDPIRFELDCEDYYPDARAFAGYEYLLRKEKS